MPYNINSELERLARCFESNNQADFFNEGEPWEKLLRSFANKLMPSQQKKNRVIDVTHENETKSQQDECGSVVGSSIWFDSDDLVYDVVAEILDNWTNHRKKVIEEGLDGDSVKRQRLRKLINNLLRNAKNRFSIQATRGMGRKTLGPPDPTDPAFKQELNPNLDRNLSKSPRPQWKPIPDGRLSLEEAIEQVLDRIDSTCSLKDRAIFKMDVLVNQRVGLSLSREENDWRPDQQFHPNAQTAGKVSKALLRRYPPRLSVVEDIDSFLGLGDEPEVRKPETNNPGRWAALLAEEFGLSGRDPIGTMYQWVFRARRAIGECVTRNQV